RSASRRTWMRTRFCSGPRARNSNAPALRIALRGLVTERRKERIMSDTNQPSAAQRMIGDFAPKLVALTDDVLFGDVWERDELSKRDRSLITVAALITGGNTEQLRGHLTRAKDNGVTEAEL